MRLIDALLRGTPRPAGVLFSSLGLVAGDPFIVTSGTTVLIDIDTPALGATSISGTVKPPSLTDTHTLTTTGITINSGGALEYGTEGNLCNGPKIVLNGAFVALTTVTIAGFTSPTSADPSNRGIMVMPGGRLDLHGASPATIWTTLNASASAAATSLTLAAAPSWASGDAVVVAPTDFVDYGNTTEQFTLSGATSGTSATLNSGLISARYGVLQYPTDAGLSTTPGTFSAQRASASVPAVLDERARVANLTRGLTISAPNDSDWTGHGHGVVIMAMASSGTNQATMRVEGVQVRRGGQRGSLGRYPFHWHIMSYNSGTGAFTADLVNSYVKKSVVWDSENRGITIHGTCGVEVSDNVTYNVKGHSYFLEDGSERRNTIQRNSAFRTVPPASGDRLKVHDGNSSGYWITNLDNTIENNFSCEATGGNGAWISLSPQCFGLSANVPIVPDSILPISLKGFVCQANYGYGLNHRSAVVDEAGNTGQGNKYPTGAFGNFTSSDHILWKNSSGAYLNFTNAPNYVRWTVADNGASDWSGSTNLGGTSSDHFGVGVSFNNVHSAPLNNLNGDGNFYPRSAFVSYHGTVRFFNCSWFNYAYSAIAYQFSSDKGQGGGVMQGGIDFYDIAPPDTTTGINSGMKLVSSHPGPMSPPLHLDGRGIDNNSSAQRHYAISGCWYDSSGYYGTAGKFMIPFNGGTTTVDDYFLVGATNLADGPTTGTVVCKTTDTKFMGMGCCDLGQFYLSWVGSPVNGNLATSGVDNNNPFTVTRQDSSGATVGTPWMVKRGDTSWALGGFRPVAAQQGARFQVDFAETNVCTISIASPAVVTFQNGANHGLSAGNKITFSTTGALPTGITAGTAYFVIASGLTGSTFEFSTTSGGAAVNTSGTQSGTQSYRFAIDTPDSMLLMDIFNPHPVVGDFLLLGLPWAGATPRICFGNSFSNESLAGAGTYNTTRNTFASAADVTAGRAIIPATSVASVAAVLADTTGMSYFLDSANKRIWVRYTNRNSSGASFSHGSFFNVDVQTVVVKV